MLLSLADRQARGKVTVTYTRLSERMNLHMKKGTRLMVLVQTAVLALGIFLIYTIVADRGASGSGDTTASSTTAATTTAATTVPPTTLPPQTQPPQTTGPVEKIDPGVLTCDYAIVADGPTGTVLYALGSQNDRIYPASITKLFTAWVALQYLEPGDPCTAGEELNFVASDSSRAFIYLGQTVTAEMAVQGMLMSSGNDAAYILAAAAGRKITGSDGIDAAEAVKVFVKEMNSQAKALGLTGTHFMNPDGYHDDNHYTTMEDLVVMGQLAMLDDTIRKYSSMAKAEVQYLSGESNTWNNTNLLIHEDSEYYMAEACGLKTGHTNASGYCLLSAIRLDDGYAIIGVFGTPSFNDRFSDTRLLAEAYLGIDWGEPVPEDATPESTGDTPAP